MLGSPFSGGTTSRGYCAKKACLASAPFVLSEHSSSADETKECNVSLE